MAADQLRRGTVFKGEASVFGDLNLAGIGGHFEVGAGCFVGCFVGCLVVLLVALLFCWCASARLSFCSRHAMCTHFSSFLLVVRLSRHFSRARWRSWSGLRVGGSTRRRCSQTRPPSSRIGLRLRYQTSAKRTTTTAATEPVLLQRRQQRQKRQQTPGPGPRPRPTAPLLTPSRQPQLQPDSLQQLPRATLLSKLSSRNSKSSDGCWVSHRRWIVTAN